MTALVRTRYECQVSSADSIDHFLIALCAALNDVSLTTTFGAFETRLIRTSSHAWSRSSERSDVALGIVGAVRMLAQLDFLGQTDVQQAQAVSWMEATEQNLLSIWRARGKAIFEFQKCIKIHLVLTPTHTMIRQARRRLCGGRRSVYRQNRSVSDGSRSDMVGGRHSHGCRCSRGMQYGGGDADVEHHEATTIVVSLGTDDVAPTAKCR